MAQLLVLESQDPDRDILMYINSPGGSFTAMTAIYDTMQYIRPQVQTFALGQAASAAAVLLAAGAPGKRLALPNARILIHQPAAARRGRARRPTSRSRPARSCACAPGSRRRSRSTRTARPQQVNKDIDRDKILSAAEALEYGLIDQVLAPRKSVPALVK